MLNKKVTYKTTKTTMSNSILINPAELADLIKTVPCVIIDTRRSEAYEESHIPDAVNLHNIFTYLATSTPEGIAELKGKFETEFGAAGLSGKETAIIYEQSMNNWAKKVPG